MLGAMVIGTQAANADTQIDSNHVRVEQGDTISEIAQEHNVSVDSLVKANHLSNPDMIFVGDTLVLTPNADNSGNTTQTPSDGDSQHMHQPVHMIENNENTVNNTTQQSSTNSNVNLSGNSMAALRRSIESGGNYNTNTGNGYIGAYQFAPQTIAGIESATGMKWSMDPATQDAFANYYANARYGGWQNTPKTGGW
jgi:LysM repeat protein